MDILDRLQISIDKCNRIINSGDLVEAEKLFKELIFEYESNLTDITNSFEYYSKENYNNPKFKVNYIKDLKTLRLKLENHYTNLLQKYIMNEYKSVIDKKSTNINKSKYKDLQSFKTNFGEKVTLEQTFKRIDEISNDKIHESEKDRIKDILKQIDSIKKQANESEIWEKTRELLLLIISDGYILALAIFPYLYLNIFSYEKD